MTALVPAIGLEVHVQLRTATKLFCGCENRFGAPPNSLVCPVCLGLPGALPVPDRRAMELGITAGLALDATIALTTRFDRKNYFYPDLPKGYQISQLDHPLASGGHVDLAFTGSEARVRLVRAHLEEDAGKAIHAPGRDVTLVDLNRAGVPLLEIVSEPDIHSAAMAFQYLTELKLILRHIGVSDCDMEKGSLRCDVNVSVGPGAGAPLGTRVEIKNLNSFRAVERAIEHEIARQEAILRSGGAVERETRLWDDEKGETRPLRRKEESEDYRYFPDPDLPPVTIPAEAVDEIRRRLPEMPGPRRARFREEYGLPDADAAVLLQDRAIADFFEDSARLSGNARETANFLLGDVFAHLATTGAALPETRLTPAGLAGLVRLRLEGVVNIPAAREILGILLREGGDAATLARDRGLGQISDRALLTEAVRRALEAAPAAAADLRAGKEKAAGAIVGAVMREFRGRANPALVNEILREILAGG